MQTFNTQYGKITLYNNETYITPGFIDGNYWDEGTLLMLKKYVDPTRNILEIGGHCGTSTIVYSTFLNNSSKIYVFEPQRKMYDLLVLNINQNGLQDKIIPNNLGVFCYSGIASMNNIDLDGGGGEVQKRYNEESNLQCNFGGISLGDNGEQVNLTTIDEMNLDNIGYIHCDAQGAENFIMSKGINTIAKNRPVILYENNQGNYLYNTVCNAYPLYKEESLFNIKDYCMNKLNYSKCITGFNNGIDDLLIP
jgi:FkbM family methyltransferase